MNQEIGLTLDERIRRELPPLCGPLRIDAFLTLMARERSRAAGERARAARLADPPRARKAAVEPEAPAVEGAPDGSLAGAETGSSDLADSKKIRAEVDAFLH